MQEVRGGWDALGQRCRCAEGAGGGWRFRFAEGVRKVNGAHAEGTWNTS